MTFELPVSYNKKQNTEDYDYIDLPESTIREIVQDRINKMSYTERKEFVAEVKLKNSLNRSLRFARTSILD